MAQFPITYSNRLPQDVQQPTGDVGGGLVADALVRAGGAMQQYGAEQRDMARRAEAENLKNQIYSETQNGKIALQEFDSETKQLIKGVTDTEEIARIGQERLSQRSDLYNSIATRPESRQALDFYTRQTAIGQVEHIEAERYSRAKQDAWISFDSIFSMAAGAGNFEILGPLAEQAYANDIIGDKEFRRYMESIDKLQEDYISQQGYAQAYDMIRSGAPMEEARQVIQDALPSDRWQTGFNNLETFRKQVEAEKATQLEHIQDETDAAFYEQFIAGSLTPEVVQQTTQGARQETWNNLLNKTDLQSTPMARIDSLRVLSAVRGGDIGRADALAALGAIDGLGRNEAIRAVDEVFKASDKVMTPDDKTRNKIFEHNISLIRGRIERPKSAFDVWTPTDVIRQQIADDAEMEFRLRFAEGQWDYDDLRRGADQILRQFPADDATIDNRVDHQEIQQAENRDAQRKYILDRVQEYRQDGKEQSAANLVQLGLDRGILSRAEIEGKPETDRTPAKRNIWQRFWDAL